VVAAHHTLEQVVGARLPIVSLYADWHTPWPAAVSRGLAGHDLLISWEPVGVDFAELLDGAWDASLTAFLEAAAGHAGQVILRPFAEMNGPWQTWSVDHEGGAVRDVEQWQAAWRHVVGLARSVGSGSRCSMLFCANTTDEGPTPVEQYWPGTEWVDAVGIDGFNWGWSADGRPLAGAEQVIGPMYDRLGRLHPTAEFVVAELGCAPAPPQAPSAQANWFAELYASRAFPRVRRVVFFHEDKECDWRLDSDPVTLAVHRASLAPH
jgi:endoglucanase